MGGEELLGKKLAAGQIRVASAAAPSGGVEKIMDDFGTRLDNVVAARGRGPTTPANRLAVGQPTVAGKPGQPDQDLARGSGLDHVRATENGFNYDDEALAQYYEAEEFRHSLAWHDRLPTQERERLAKSTWDKWVTRMKQFDDNLPAVKRVLEDSVRKNITTRGDLSLWEAFLSRIVLKTTINAALALEFQRRLRRLWGDETALTSEELRAYWQIERETIVQSAQGHLPDRENVGVLHKVWQELNAKFANVSLDGRGRPQLAEAKLADYQKWQSLNPIFAK